MNNNFEYWKRVMDVNILKTVTSKLNVEYKTLEVCPSIQYNIFKAFKLCPYKDLKVVMIGQDFY